MRPACDSIRPAQDFAHDSARGAEPFSTLAGGHSMRSIRCFRSALRRALLPCAGAAALFAGAADAVPGGYGIEQGQGFDACTAPSTSTMQKWWTNTPWSWVGIYIGGSVRACSQPNLTAAWMNTTYAQGWRYELLWVGPQAPCSAFSRRFSYDTGTAYDQGKAEAISAYNALVALGFGNALNTPVTYDLEAYPNSSSCRAAAKSFMQGWVDQLA